MKKKYNCYIVNSDTLKIMRDNVDFQRCYRVEHPCTAEDFAKGIYSKTLIYLFGEQNLAEHKGSMYLADICFKTKEEAEAKLKEIILGKIHENLNLIDNAKKDTVKLYKKLDKLVHGRK